VAPINVIIFDTAPSVGGIQERAIWAAQWLLIPSKPDYLSMAGVKKLGEDAMRMKETMQWQGALLGLLPTIVEGSLTNESSAHLEDMQKIGGKLCLDPIHQAVALREASSSGITIFDYDPTCRAAQEYGALAKYVFKALTRSAPIPTRAAATRAPEEQRNQ
jgi:chromosome partitioning protein